MSLVFSNKKELKEISELVQGYFKLPISEDTIQGDFFEKIIAEARNAKRLNTYEFIDVVDEKNKVAWQVKSTKEKTPLTWKRVKLKDSKKLIEESFQSFEKTQELGELIINFCNLNAKESIDKYNLKEIGFSRIISNLDGTLSYYEKILCTKENPIIFNKDNYIWKWSEQKTNGKKEMLKSLQGFDKITGLKMFSWHGQGENQLHFVGDKYWLKENIDKVMTIKKPNDKRSMDFLKNL